MSEEMTNIINSIVQVVLIPLAGVLVGYLVAYIKKATAKLIEENKTDVLDKYIKIASDLIIECVDATNQTYVSEFKKNGNVFDEDAQKCAFNMTKTAILNSLNSTAKQALAYGIEDLDTWIDTKIEAAVLATKRW